MAKIKPTRIDEYERTQIWYEQNSHQSSRSAQRTTGRNRLSDEAVSDECGWEDNSWQYDAQ